MDINEASKHFGHNALADLIGITPQALTNWLKRGVPIYACAAVEAATGKVVRRWELRPTDWHVIWPELIGSADAPPVPQEA